MKVVTYYISSKYSIANTLAGRRHNIIGINKHYRQDRVSKKNFEDIIDTFDLLNQGQLMLTNSILSDEKTKHSRQQSREKIFLRTFKLITFGSFTFMRID